MMSGLREEGRSFLVSVIRELALSGRLGRGIFGGLGDGEIWVIIECESVRSYHLIQDCSILVP